MGGSTKDEANGLGPRATQESTWALFPINGALHLERVTYGSRIANMKTSSGPRDNPGYCASRFSFRLGVLGR
jgi:hypothetical protein